MAQTLGALVVTATTALTPCVKEALEVPPRDRAVVMCALAEENRALRALGPCPPPPPPPPPKVENNLLELLGAGVVGVVVGGAVVWMTSQ